MDVVDLDIAVAAIDFSTDDTVSLTDNLDLAAIGNVDEEGVYRLVVVDEVFVWSEVFGSTRVDIPHLARE